jgi:hypothetical protein
MIPEYGTQRVRAIATRDASGNYPPTSATSPVPARLAGTASGLTLATLAQGTKQVASAGTPERLVAVAGRTTGRRFLIKATKPAGAPNAGIVVLGTTATASAQHLALAPGGVDILKAAPGEYLDLYYFYLDAATSADGLAWIKLG